MEKKKATQGSQFGEVISPHFNTSQPIQSTAKATQRGYILQCLKQQPHSTFDFRAKGICAPAPRVHELRAQGHNITTAWQRERDATGMVHRIAVYSLLAGESEVQP